MWCQLRNYIQNFKTLIDNGLKAKGYNYVNIDDSWSNTRNIVTKELIHDPYAFPDGIAKLAERVHDLGLKIGIDSDSANKTCTGRPGSFGYE